MPNGKESDASDLLRKPESEKREEEDIYELMHVRMHAEKHKMWFVCGKAQTDQMEKIRA